MKARTAADDEQDEGDEEEDVGQVDVAGLDVRAITSSSRPCGR